MDIKYSLFNPTGNITALVETPVEVKDQPKYAEEILAKEPMCEQVGYLSRGNEEADIVLRMAGGEFCGNATMSAAAFYCIRENLHVNTKRTVKVLVLENGLVPVEVEVKAESVAGKISMPKPLEIKEVSLEYENREYVFPIVVFGGISHLITEESMPDRDAETAVKKWADDLKVKGLGIMFLDREREEIRPLVYVKEPETLYWESSCGSGTTAVGAYLFTKEKKTGEYRFKEPGGELSITLSKEGEYLLGGEVRQGVLL